MTQTAHEVAMSGSSPKDSNGKSLLRPTIVSPRWGLVGRAELSHNDPKVAEAYGTLLDAQVSFLVEVLDDGSKRIERTKVSRDLTATGVANAVSKIRAEDVGKIREMHAKRGGKLNQDLAEAQRSFPGTIRPPDWADPAEMARLIEIRSRL